MKTSYVLLSLFAVSSYFAHASQTSSAKKIESNHRAIGLIERVAYENPGQLRTVCEDSARALWGNFEDRASALAVTACQEALFEGLHNAHCKLDEKQEQLKQCADGSLYWLQGSLLPRRCPANP